MPDANAEQAAHAHAKALVDGDVATAFLGMTPEGLAGAMEIGNTTWNIMGRLGLQYRFRDIDGVWKVAGVERAT